MRWTGTLIPTQKQDPAGAANAHHRLLLRGGFVRQLGAGTYGMLPLGARVLRKVETIVRAELEAAGCVEVMLPAVLPPADPRGRGGRAIRPGPSPAAGQDGRAETAPPASPTYEARAAQLVAGAIQSYRQLPTAAFHVGPRFGDDDGRSGAGLIRLRESHAAWVFGFYAGASGGAVVENLRRAFARVVSRCGLPFVRTDDPAGDNGHSFLCPAGAGEDAVLVSDRGNYAAAAEDAQTGDRPWTFAGPGGADLLRVHTPGASTVEQAAAVVGVRPADALKTLVFRTDATGPALSSVVNPRWVVAVVRGDHPVSLTKLARAARETFRVGVLPMGAGDDAELRDQFAVGFVGPHAAARTADAVLIVDPDAAQDHADWVTGANEADYHVRHFNWFRECGDALADPRKVLVADIRQALPGDPSPRNDGGRLAARSAIEVGRIGAAGGGDAGTPGLTVLDEAGRPLPVQLTSGRLDFERILAAAVETHHDEQGIRWPAAIAPYSVVITPIGYDGDVKVAADDLYAQLNAAGIDTILDDRDARPGVKFADADLVGFPLRINVGERRLAEGAVELKRRLSSEVQVVPLADVVQIVRRSGAKP